MEQVTLAGGTVAAPTNGTPIVPTNGTAGIQDQVGNQPATVSGAAMASGGVNGGNFIEPDIDDELFKFSSDDTPLMNLMLKAKTVNVTSAEVDHYSIDEPTAMVTVASASDSGTLNLNAADKMKVHAYDVLAAVGVNGYTYTDSSGNAVNTMSNRPLQLFVTSVTDNDTIVVKAINGVKTYYSDEYGTMPINNNPSGNSTNVIGEGTKLVILGNALYETQKEVDPDLVLPQPERIYLQKRGMNQVVSDYFESQRKRIPFSKAIIAEAAIRNFKTKGNRTLWVSQPAKFRVKAKKTGDMQYVYNTTGVRWQFKREVEHTGKWTYEDFIALAKLFYTGEDVPKSCLVLCGKNFLESIQCIDWSNHTEAKIEVKKNETLGWKVTAITTVFGEFQFKREPTLDRLGYENCAALIGEDRLVHYKRTAEKSFSEKVEGEEATRSGVLVWDALALKGSCHIWVDGKGGETATGATEFKLWSGNTTPTLSGSLIAGAPAGTVFYLEQDVTLSSGTTTHNATATTYNGKAGELWQATLVAPNDSYTSEYVIKWTKYNAGISAS